MTRIWLRRSRKRRVLPGIQWAQEGHSFAQHNHPLPVLGYPLPSRERARVRGTARELGRSPRWRSAAAESPAPCPPPTGGGGTFRTIYRAVLPLFPVLGAEVLGITYLPFLGTALPDWLGR